MSVERLVKEFGAQDVGAYMTVFRGGTHYRVAEWNEGNKMWVMLPAGSELLDPSPVVEVVESAKQPHMRVKRTKAESVFDEE